MTDAATPGRWIISGTPTDRPYRGSQFPTARPRGQPPRQARRPAAPPVEPHRFVPSGMTDRPLGRETCARCPLPETRTDVHHTPTTSEDARALDARILGEHEETNG